MNHEPLVIVDGARSPFTRMGTALADTPADDIARQVLRALLDRTCTDPASIDEVIIGCVAAPARTANIARVIALRAGLPVSVPAFTVNRNCASGAEALLVAEDRFRSGRGTVFVVGGVENMSQYPLLYSASATRKFGELAQARSLGQRLRALRHFRPSDFKPIPGLLVGLQDPVCGLGMGDTAEVLAREWHISRETQDAFAAQSHRRALAAAPHHAEEMVSVMTAGNTPALVDTDTGPRDDSTEERLARLRPAFDRTSGTVTAGNASQITDGAALLLVMGASEAERRGLSPLGVLRGGAVAGCDPSRMGLGPVYAIHAAEQRTGIGLADADRIELNEAFAAQVLACQAAAASSAFAAEHLDRSTPVGTIDTEQLNVNGGAIALGHPLGATGARLILTALLELKRTRQRRALITACVGGGQGIALWIERP